VGLENITVLEFADYEYEDLAREPPEPTFQAPAGSSLRNLFAYGQHTWTPLPYLEATAGLRLDKRVPTGGQDPSKAAFDLFASPRLGLLVVPGEALTAKVLYGRAFRSPSVRELLVQAELDPETQVYPWANGSLRRRAEYIDTFEAEAIVQLADPVQVRVDGFYSYLGREIDKVSPPNEYRNLKGRLHIVGGEAGVELQVDMVSLELGYALTHARYADVRGNPYRGRRQYEFPPHMVKGATRAALTDHLTATLFGELYSGRPRREWSPDAGVPDGLAFGLLHLGVHLSEVGPGERTSIGLAVRNLTDAEWGTGVYRADVNVLNSDGSTRFPEEMSGEGRSVQVSLEVAI